MKTGTSDSQRGVARQGLTPGLCAHCLLMSSNSENLDSNDGLVMHQYSEEIYNDSFGLWISGVFSAVSGHNPDLTFNEKKEEFFSILRTWLIDEKIFFCHPDDPLGCRWIADADEIISYILYRWPDSAETEDDADLNIYFYEIPAVIWVGSDGSLIGS